MNSQPNYTPSADSSVLAIADDYEIHPPIKAYAAIGDCRTLALVSLQGSVDWLCLPSISAVSVFAALLDRRRGGRFALRPSVPFRTERRYLDGTNVLETTFIVDGGRARILDSMSINGADGGGLEPERELLRIAEGLEGHVPFEVLYDPRPDYARAVPRLKPRGSLGWSFQHRGEAFLLGCELDMAPAAGGAGLQGAFVIGAQERRRFSLVHATRDMLIVPPLGIVADRRLDTTTRWWRDWSHCCGFQHRYRPAILRSALTLKLLTYGLSGAVVAAGTTSLPEAVGAERNYDYRFCWLRDAATTLRAFFGLGFQAEGRAYLEWLLHSTRLTRPRLMVLYDVHGRPKAKQLLFDHLDGYRDSLPIRIGNDAAGQLQHDVYGSAIDAAAAYIESGGVLGADERRLLLGYGRIVCRTWREPDSGLWEIPGPRRHYVHSKVMCWSALNTLLRLHDEGHLAAPTALFAGERDAIRTAIEVNGMDATRTHFIGAFGEDWVDASLLVMGRLGYLSPNDTRIVATADRIWSELGRNELLLRYRPEVDGLDSREGAFGICLFWAAELLALQGKTCAAAELFERGLSLANDVGLLAEEFDPATGAALGNVPQAFTHAGLISAGLAIARAETSSSVKRQEHSK